MAGEKLRGDCRHASASGTNQQSDRQPANRQLGSRGLDSIWYQFEQDGNSNPYLLTFKVLGHDEVSILNGGMAAYKKAKKQAFPIETVPNSLQPKTFQANFKKEWVLSRDQVRQAFENGDVVLDSRTDDQFMGLNKHPKANVLGTIPGSINVPQDWLTLGGKGTFRDIPALKQIMKRQGVPDQSNVITFCNTDHLASIDWFVLSELLGNLNVRMYDESLLDWTAADFPMELKIKI